MALEIEGKVYKVLPEQSGEGRNGTWVKQDFVIETMGEFPKKICFSTWGERTQAVKTLQINQLVRVSFRPESREYNEKWYTDLRAWRVEPLSMGGTTQQVQPNDAGNTNVNPASNQQTEQKQPPVDTQDNIDTEEENENDLPF